MYQREEDGRRKIYMNSDTVNKDGRWNAHSVGQTITDGLTECLSTRRNLIALLSECILSNII